MRARVQSFERLSDGGMVAHVEWINDQGETVLLDHVRLPEWDELAGDELAQAEHLHAQLRQRRAEIERREAVRQRLQTQPPPVIGTLAGAEIVLDDDGMAYVEVVERRRVRLEEHVRGKAVPRPDPGNRQTA